MSWLMGLINWGKAPLGSLVANFMFAWLIGLLVGRAFLSSNCTLAPSCWADRVCVPSAAYVALMYVVYGNDIVRVTTCTYVLHNNTKT